VIDRGGIVRWAATFPDAVNPGADGLLSALEALRPAPAASGELESDNRTGTDPTTCPCGCGLSTAQVGKYRQLTSRFRGRLTGS
jgi:hypothetical protein